MGFGAGFGAGVPKVAASSADFLGSNYAEVGNYAFASLLLRVYCQKLGNEESPVEIVTKYAVACAIVGILPCSFPFLVGLEIAMVYHLSVVHRIPFRLGELGIIWAIVVPTSFILKLIVEAILVWFPGPGWIVKGAIAFGFVMLAGKLIDSYYATERSKLGS